MPTAPTIISVSGNSFSVTVTPCELDNDITLRDFIVLESGTPTANPTSYNKTSPTTIQYAGPTLPTTTLEVRRFTPRGQRQLAGVGITKVSSQAWNKEFDRRVRIQEEVDTFGAGGGFSVRLPIDAPYDITWNGDTLFSPTRNSLYGALQTLAPLDSPTFTGTPIVPTQLTSDSSTRVATTAYVKSNLLVYAPLASPPLSGNPTATTQLVSDNSTRLATTAYVKNNLTGYATLLSPALTGTPLTPTQALGTSNTSIATMQALQRRSQPIVLAGHSTGMVLPANVFVDVAFDTEFSDVANVYNNSTGIFTAPYTGLYHIVCSISSTTTTLLALGLFNTANVELVRLGTAASPTSTFLATNGSTYYRLTSGEQIKLRAFSPTSANLQGGTTLNYLNIVYAGIVT